MKSTLGAGKLTEPDLNFLKATIYDNKGGDYEQKISYFLVPALIKYKFKNNALFLKLNIPMGISDKKKKEVKALKERV